MSQLRTGENSNYASGNINSFNKVEVNYIIIGADEQAEILAWLSPLESWIRHDNIRAHRIEHVGDWLLRTPEYRRWFNAPGGESDNSALFCHGDPGVGKTYITSLVIDRICDWAMGRNATVVCFYFDFAAQKEQSPTAVLSSLLRQLVQGLERIPAKIVQGFRDQKAAGGRRLGLDQVVEMLQDLSTSRRTFICIDAIDECVAEYRAKLFVSLKKILRKSLNTRIFLAGRSHIQDELEKHLRMAVAISTTPTRDDIIRFLRAKLKEDTIPDAMDENLEEEIVETIPATVSEIFLLVSLNIKAILQETTLHRRREKLRAMTDGVGLGGAYGATIERIKAQEGDRARLGMEALMWISHSRRPLNVDEICHALAVEAGSADINAKNVPSIRTLLSCCQGLAVVDKGSSIIRLIHFTLKEHLSRHADLFDSPHAKIAEICLTYLNFQTIKHLSASSAYDSRVIPFLEYSALNWGTHMRMKFSGPSRDLALKLLDQYDNHIAAELLAKSADERRFKNKKPFSALHCVSYFGIAEVAIDLIRTKRWCLNERDSSGLTPLMWAARYGREEVAKVLLEQKETRPHMRDTQSGQTAFSWAARGGYEGVVNLFLGPLFVNPGSMGHWRGTPRAMRLLFGKRYLNPDKSDNYRRTPLALAARNGHVGVVNLLLGRREVNPNWRHRDGRTLLSLAAENGRDGVVKLLLGRREVSPDRQDDCGRTPLSRAAEQGGDKVVELLLEQEDVSPDRPDKLGRTPLLWAARNGRVGVVKLLLERKDVNPNRSDNDGQTLLSWATRNDRVAVVELLLGREEVDPGRPENGYQSVLWWAAKNRHDGVVKLLLEREDVNPNRPDNDGQTLLLWATRNGCVGIVELLVRRKEVDPNRPDEGGQTLLLWATRNGHDGVVKQLLDREDVSPDMPGNDGRTPLSWASSWNGGYGVVELLLEREDVSPDQPDINGQTPLSWAASYGCNRVVELLLEREDVNPDQPDINGQTPLSLAAKNGSDGVVELLLERGNVSPDRLDNNGQTPLSWAAQYGCDKVVELLLEREDVSPDRPDNGGRTPLSWASSWNGGYGAVELLLKQNEVNPNRPDNNGRTPSWWAAQNGRSGVAELLEAQKDAASSVVSGTLDIKPAPSPWCVLA